MTKHFGAWTGGAAAAITIPPAPPAKGGRIYLVDRPDAAQTVVAQWIPGPARTTPDYDVLNLVDAVWGGGGFGTRLNLNLRENKAYSYGVFSNFNLMRAAGNWAAGRRRADGQDGRVDCRVRQGAEGPGGRAPISADELAVAKQRRVRGYAQQFESLDRITGEIANLWALGPADGRAAAGVRAPPTA